MSARDGDSLNASVEYVLDPGGEFWESRKTVHAIEETFFQKGRNVYDSRGAWMKTLSQDILFALHSFVSRTVIKLTVWSL